MNNVDALKELSVALGAASTVDEIEGNTISQAIESIKKISANIPRIKMQYEYRLEEKQYTTEDSYAARASKEFTIPWFSHAVGEKIIVKYDGKEFELEIKSYDTYYNGMGNLSLVISQYPVSDEIPFYIKLRKTNVSENAIVYVNSREESHSLAIYTKSSIPVPIDEQFIPDLSSVTLNSSTEGSEKKFKVTVDDSGTLTASEITE